MTAKRSGLPAILLVPLVAGLGVAALWIVRAGAAPLLTTLRGAKASGVVAMLAVTVSWFAVRFIRSQYLLRRAGIRLPIRPVLATYLAALPGTATPGYVGEIVRSVFVRRRFGVPLRASVPVLAIERLYDIAALGIAAVAVGGAFGRIVGVGALTLSFAGMLATRQLSTRLGMPQQSLTRLFRPATIVASLFMSLAAWSLAAMLYSLGANALFGSLSASDAVAVFSQSTLLGAITLSPAGAGVTGSAAIVQLTALGYPAADAVPLVTLVRLMGTGVTLAVGLVFLWRELRGPADSPELVAHFDTIAAEYAEQWSPHVWDLLLERKIRLMASELPAPEASGRGVDLGCGLGIQTREMRVRGFHVVGIEPSVGLLRQRVDRMLPLVAGDALTLPFADGSIDFVYVIGVLHHLPGPGAQAVARDEIARVLRPGGLLLVHESNPRNPFFRFYMGYVFPILKSIDEGTEHWIDPRDWEKVPGMRLVRVRYFTFLPDFTPRFLLKAALAVEQLLERGPTRAYSAHYLAVVQRSPDNAAKH